MLARAFSDPERVRAIQRGYLRFFAGADRVLDLGCGGGGFLDLLRDTGISALGVDASAAAVEELRARGHEVRVGDAVEALARMAGQGETFGGVFLSHVLEHLPPARAPELFRGVAGALRSGGRAVVVTPNPRNLLVITEVFWLDPTHVRPWPRPLVERLGAAVGLEVLESFDDPATAPPRSALRRIVARARSALSGADRSGPMDSVVVFGKP
jgi:O-antigen chain-terminating methyltransferase